VEAALASAFEAERAQAVTVIRFLDPKQVARLREIVLQQEGPYALARPEVASRLGLKPIQVQRVRRFLDEADEVQALAVTARVIPPETPDGRPAPPPPTLEQVRAETARRVEGVLTPGQRKAFQAMLGEPFALPTPKLPPLHQLPPALRDALKQNQPER
jgi:hypothetical protein